MQKIGKMEIRKFVKFLMFVAVGADMSLANGSESLETFALLVFKGGKAFGQDEIAWVATHPDWEDHQKVILQTQMLGSVEDLARYRQAIDLATHYIESGRIEWARDYLRMQRAFAYNLTEDREIGNTELEMLVDRDAFKMVSEIRDPLMNSIRVRQKDLPNYLNDAMRQSIGHYYLDFRKAGSLPEKAFYYFDGIKSNGLREKCMIQVKDRTGEAFEQLNSANVHSRFAPNGASGSNSNNESLKIANSGDIDLGSRESKKAVKLEKRSFLTLLISAKWIVGFAVVIVGLIGYLTLRLRSD